MRAAIYARVSTAEQSDGISLEMQQQRCADWIRSRGWAIAETYQDIDTGRHARRPQLIRLRRRLHRYEAMVVFRLDRATRSMADLCSLLEECERARTVFVSVSESFDVAQPFGQATAQILGVIAQLESSNIGERVRAAKRALIEQKRPPWKPKYGYRRDGDSGRFVIDDAEAAVIRRIFRERAQGSRLADITEGLNGENLLRRGLPWTWTKLSAVLHDTTYIGKYVRGTKRHVGGQCIRLPREEWDVVPDLAPSIVTVQEWATVHKTELRGRRPTVPALFRGLFVCICAHRVYVHSRKEKAGEGYVVDYRCSTRQKGGQCAAPQTTEAIAAFWFKALVEQTARNRRRWYIEAPSKDEAEAAVEQAQGVWERVSAAYKRDLMKLQDLEEARAALRVAEANAADTEARLASREVTERAVGQCLEALKFYKAGDTATANETLRSAIARIEVDTRQKVLRIVLSAHVRAEVG